MCNRNREHFALHVFEQGPMRWKAHPIEKSLLLSAEWLEFLGIDTAVEPNGELSVFASTQNGDLVWRPERLAPWQIPELPYPPRFLECASTMVDDRLMYQRRSVMDLAVEDGFIHMAHHDCSALVLVQKPVTAEEPLCVTLVPVEGEAVRHISEPEEFRSALAARPGAIVVATSRGGIYLSEW